MNRRQQLIPFGQDVPSRWADVVAPYRYLLGRRWNRGLRYRRILWVMLNPSTADALQDDPTLRRCVGFSKRWSFDSLEIVNLFAFQSPKPTALRRAEDPIGTDNDCAIMEAAERASLIMVAWGNSIPREYPDRAFGVLTMLRASGRTIRALGKTNAGHPLHPLYIPANRPPVLWAP